MRLHPALACAALAVLAMAPVIAAEMMVPVPAYVDTTPTATTATEETAVLAGGCFWGVQGVFEHLKGVTRAVSGYAGGAATTAHYEIVGSGRTGHAESVRVTFDPRVVSYAQILQVFFSVAHDPTQLNRQGPDTGTQYRSTIFPRDDVQARVATDYIEQLNRSHVFKAPIVTTLERDKSFFPAEAYHQDFLERNPQYPYIVYNDLPKVAGLKRLFPDGYRAQAVLALAAASH